MKQFLFLIALLPAAAHAQALSCAVPAQVDRPHFDGPDAKTPRRDIPTASYSLALTWSPQFCKGDERNAFQCDSANRFGFTLHGLWPDGAGKDWPQYCKPVELISEAAIRANLCATPSAQLLQHEYAKHASCMNVSADDYFRRSTGLYGKLRFPDMNALSRRPGLTAGMLASAIARANPGMTPGMMRITATKGGWLDEIWFCLDLNYRYKQCKPNTGGVTPNARLKIWRDER